MTVWCRQTWFRTEPERIFGAGGLDRGLDGFGDGDAQTARAIGVLVQFLPAEFGLVAGRWVHGGAPGLHHQFAVGLLMEANAHHEHLAIEAEELAGHGQGRTPLAGAGFGDQVFGACLFVEIGLGDGGVEFVGSGGRDALVFVVDMGGGIQGLFKPNGSKQGRGAPEGIDVPHLFGDIDPVLGAHFLHDEVHGEDGAHQVGRHGFLGARVQGRRHGSGEIRQDVVPLGWDIFLGKIKTISRAHGGSFNK